MRDFESALAVVRGCLKEAEADLIEAKRLDQQANEEAARGGAWGNFSASTQHMDRARVRVDAIRWVLLRLGQ